MEEPATWLSDSLQQHSALWCTCKGGARFSSCECFKGKDPRSWAGKGGITINHYFEAELRDMKTRVLWKRVGLEASLSSKTISVQKLVMLGECHIMFAFQIQCSYLWWADLEYDTHESRGSGGWRNVIRDNEFKEMRGQDVKIIRNEPDSGWKESEP